MNERGSNILSSTFISELSRIFNWLHNEKNVGFIAEECNSDKTNVDQNVADCKRV